MSNIRESAAPFDTITRTTRCSVSRAVCEFTESWWGTKYQSRSPCLWMLITIMLSNCQHHFDTSSFRLWPFASLARWRAVEEENGCCIRIETGEHRGHEKTNTCRCFDGSASIHSQLVETRYSSTDQFWQRFVVRFGPDGQPCAPVLMLLGFTLLVSNLCTCWYSYWLWYKNDCWTVPQPDLGESFPIASSHNVFLDNAEAELSALIIDRPAEERTASQDTTRLDSAYDYLSRALSCQNCMLSFIIVFALYWQSVDDKESSTRNIQKSLIQRRRYDSYSNHNSLTHINPQSLYRTWHSRWC